MFTARSNGLSVYVGDGAREAQVAQGTAPVVDTENNLWWLSNGNLLKAAVNSDLTIGTTATVGPARSFAVKDVGNLGVVSACLHSSTLTLRAGSQVYDLAWAAGRSDDFDFEFAADMQTLSVIYRLPGSPLQAYVDLYSSQSDSFIIVDSLLRVYNFELGARTLDPKAENLTR